MKKLILTSFAVALGGFVFGQGISKEANQAKRDSLKAIWHNFTQADSSRFQALEGMIRTYRKEPDSILYFTLAELNLAREKELKQYEGNALYTLGIYYYLQSDYPQSLDYFRQSLEARKEVEDKEGMANSMQNIGLIAYHKGDFTLALDYNTRSMKIQEELGNEKGIAGLLNNIGNIYMRQGNLAKALNHLSRSLKIKEKLGDKAGIASSLSGIGIIYYEQENYHQGLEYFNRSLKILEEMGNKREIGRTLHNIGKNYYGLEDYEKAQEYFSRSLQINEEIGNKRAISYSLESMGTIYKQNGNYSRALDYFSRSLKIKEEIGEINKIPGNLHEIGDIYQAQGDHTQAIFYGEKALQIARGVGEQRVLKIIAENLYTSYKSIGRSTQALEMHELYISARDSLEREENQRATLRYEFEQKALKDSLAQVEKSLQQELAFQDQLHQKDQTRNILIALGLIALILAVGFFARNRFIQRTNAQLKAAKQRAEHSEAVKEQFLANMSHEIRTPMHAISGMLKILERNDHPKAQEVFLEAMHKSSDNLIVLLNDILDLSKIEAGKLHVENIPMQPTEVLDTVEQILQYKAEEKGLQLHTAYSSDLPTNIMGDPTRLNQILTNLAGNAIKFTEKGSVSISVNKKSEFLLFEVRDTGIGIPEDKLLSIFDAFEQAEGSTVRRFGGTGLGLNISRQLVELMGGNIWAESSLGEGSSFFVSLPLIAVEGDVADKQSLSEEQIMEMGAALSGRRILVAEDNEFNQMIARDDLTYYIKDAQVDIVENGRLAFEKAQTGLYDLILMDVQMPEMDGIEASLKIREWEQTNGKTPIPIIAMTASLLKSEVNLCLEAGMDNYVPKPYEAEELVGRMYREIIQYKGT